MIVGYWDTQLCLVIIGCQGGLLLLAIIKKEEHIGDQRHQNFPGVTSSISDMFISDLEIIGGNGGCQSCLLIVLHHRCFCCKFLIKCFIFDTGSLWFLKDCDPNNKGYFVNCCNLSSYSKHWLYVCGPYRETSLSL